MISDWFDLLAVQGDSQESSPTPQFKSISSLALSFLSKERKKIFLFLSKTIFFLLVQLSHPYMTSRRTTALTRWISVGKVMFLLFNMLSKCIIAFLPRSKHLFISWLQSPCAVILEPEERNSVTVSIVSPSVCHEVVGLDAMILVF